jgi:NDP-sugar pyrophosphorylase family protein
MKAFKPLLPVGGKPMVQRCIDLFSDNGITDIVVVTGHLREQLEPVVRDAGACPVFHPGLQTSGPGRPDSFCFPRISRPFVRPRSPG